LLRHAGARTGGSAVTKAERGRLDDNCVKSTEVVEKKIAPSRLLRSMYRRSTCHVSRDEKPSSFRDLRFLVAQLQQIQNIRGCSTTSTEAVEKHHSDTTVADAQ
jgi:hypothetical protein